MTHGRFISTYTLSCRPTLRPIMKERTRKSIYSRAGFADVLHSTLTWLHVGSIR